MKQHIAFRVDASVDIGSGHVMRCLSLAAALSKAGACCSFICRAHPGHLIKQIREQGHLVYELPEPESVAYGDHPNTPTHAAWLAGAWRHDATETRRILDLTQPEWLILDHYALDKSWEEAAVPVDTPLAVIDDLADRQHRARLLLDQNFGRAAEEYAKLVPENCAVLVGPMFALLRAEFAEARPRALARPSALRPRHLLISLGGVDKNNASSAILKAIDALNPPLVGTIRVIIGNTAPHREAVLDQSRRMLIPTEVLIGVKNMAEHMLWADFSIGAAGSSTWERCCMALPTLVLTLADNQKAIAQELGKIGISRYLGDYDAGTWQQVLPSALLDAKLPIQLQSMSAAAAALCDGQGSDRVASHLLGKE